MVTLYSYHKSNKINRKPRENQRKNKEKIKKKKTSRFSAAERESE
jgi:hypothetical protein